MAAALRPTFQLQPLEAWLPLGHGQDLVRGQEQQQQHHQAAAQQHRLLLLLLQVVQQGLLLRGHQGLRAWVQGFWGLAFLAAAPLGFREEGREQG